MSGFLRTVLLADAVVSGATGAVMVLGSTLLQEWLGLPATLLFYAGVALLPYAAVVAYVGSRAHVLRGAVWAIVACNAAWAVDSLLLLATGWVSPGSLGVAFVVFQAVVVAGFSELQFLGLRRVPATAVA